MPIDLFFYDQLTLIAALVDAQMYLSDRIRFASSREKVRVANCQCYMSLIRASGGM